MGLRAFLLKNFYKNCFDKSLFYTGNYILESFLPDIGLTPIIFEMHLAICLSRSKIRLEFCENSSTNLLSCSLKLPLKSQIIKMCVKQVRPTFQIFR